jgi:hypothetical protein
VRITFNPNVARVTPIRRIVAKYPSRAAAKLEEMSDDPFEAVDISISREAQARAARDKEERERREGKRGFWNALTKAVTG